jgi:hypothetical protein
VSHVFGGGGHVELNDYSSRFLAVLLRAFPESGENVAAAPEPGCFTIEFAAPSGSAFWVATEEFDRVTVGFDVHHLHFGGWAESADAEDFENAVGYIRRLQSGEYLVAVWSRSGGAYAGSVAFTSGEAPQPWGSGEGLTVAIKGWQPQGEQKHTEPGAADVTVDVNARHR